MRISDWSSDVCSSDLVAPRIGLPLPALRLALLDERINTFDSYAKQRFHRRFDLGLGSIARNLEHNGIVFGKKRRLFRNMRSNDHIIVAVVGGFGLILRIGRASGRERVCWYVMVSVGVVVFKNKKFNYEILTQIT